MLGIEILAQNSKQILFVIVKATDNFAMTIINVFRKKGLKYKNRLQSTPVNSNLQGKSKSSSYRELEENNQSKVKNSFYCTVNILITEMLSENWKILLGFKSQRNATKHTK